MEAKQRWKEGEKKRISHNYPVKAVKVKAQAETYTENSHTHPKGLRCTGTANRENNYRVFMQIKV